MFVLPSPKTKLPAPHRQLPPLSSFLFVSVRGKRGGVIHMHIYTCSITQHLNSSSHHHQNHLEIDMTSSPTMSAARFSLCLSLSDIPLIILVVGLLEFLLFHLLTAAKAIHASLSALRPHPPPSTPAPQPKKLRSQPSLSSGDTAVVLRSLGMLPDGGPASLDAGDLFEMFEEENPSLGEVKEAFDVFDEDRDGFIDAEELQRVVCSLGLKEGSELENCRRMIALGDEDGDGRIDFDEFVMFMERNLC